MAVGGGGGCVGVAVGGTGVAVGGTGVAVGGTGVAVGGTGVAVGGTGVAVGTGVLVAVAVGVRVAEGVGEASAAAGLSPSEEPSRLSGAAGGGFCAPKDEESGMPARLTVGDESFGLLSLRSSAASRPPEMVRAPPAINAMAIVRGSMTWPPAVIPGGHVRAAIRAWF